jgi:hypothetical protein
MIEMQHGYGLCHVAAEPAGIAATDKLAPMILPDWTRVKS